MGDYSGKTPLSDFAKSTIITNSADEPSIGGIIYTSSKFTPLNQYPKTGEPIHAPNHPKITFPMNEAKPGLA